eukprot:CAMPEP_0198443436 /NCGR_PEP_ID=MMETSP1452-20131203/70096_1 /TAXON_ID=1181717 /ORGANISM="Synchroma pusillum, Strain CCMP3072" /LENGTH=1118 /DNA_ID=CAMNT_0044164073 /DNA_START=74 /DNA_END=3431 /DNA_ORIENTATION=-
MARPEGCLALLALLPLCSAVFYLPGAAPVDFKPYQQVKLYASKLTSTKTQVPYDFYSLPFCRHKHPHMEQENLGERLSGDKIESSVYKLHMKVPKACEVACSRELKKAEAAAFQEAIDQDYRVHFIVDNLPVGMIMIADTGDRVFTRGFPVGFAEDDGVSKRYYLFNHLRIVIQYNDGLHMEQENLGERLSGDRIESSVYKLHMKVPKACEVACLRELNKADAEAFKEAIDQDYRVHFIVDNLPVGMTMVAETGEQVFTRGFPVGFSEEDPGAGPGKGAGKTRHYIFNHLRIVIQYNDAMIMIADTGDRVFTRGFPVGFAEDDGVSKRYYLFNHLRIVIQYNDGHPPTDAFADTDSKIVGFRVEPYSIQHTWMGPLDKGTTVLDTCNAMVQPKHEPGQYMEVKPGAEVLFTYDVYWERDLETEWSHRWDVYLTAKVDSKVHWFSITNSTLIVLFLTVMIAMILVRTLRRDIAAYNDPVEEAKEESGWKLVHADVFRPPRTLPMLFSVLVGSGAQLFYMSLLTLTFALLGFLSPANRGSLVTALILLFVFMGSAAGYCSSRVYKMFRGVEWKQNTLMTAFLFPGCVFAGVGVLFTYDVYWERDLETEWSHRWDVYLTAKVDSKVHWFSITNSTLIVLFLTVMIAMILVRTLRRDIAQYNEMGGSAAAAEEAKEESGWKLVHADVFRPPRTMPMLFSVLVGSGAQLFYMSLLTLTFALLGFLSPANRGSLITALILLYVFMGSAAGYCSSRVYKMFRGVEWKHNTLMTAFLFPGCVFAVYFVLNVALWSEGSSGALPFSTFFTLLFLWFGVSVPLVFVGSFFGYKKEAVEHPVRTNQIPRQIPPQPWFMHPALCVAFGGVLPFGAVSVECFFLCSSRVYKMFRGVEWKHNTLMTAFLFPGCVFAVFFVLNVALWSEGSSGALPFGTFFTLLFLWFGVSVPLVFVGSFFGYKKEVVQHPVRTNQIPRQVPPQPWFMHPALCIAFGGVLPFGAVSVECFFLMSSVWLHQIYYIFGFLFLVMLILIATCAEITILLCYFQLVNEDYRWWWRSFLTSGACAGYLMLYAVWYHMTELDFEGPVALLLYYGYMALTSLTFFLITGTIGFYACFWFNTKIFGSLKVD